MCMSFALACCACSVGLRFDDGLSGIIVTAPHTVDYCIQHVCDCAHARQVSGVSEPEKHPSIK